MEKAISIDKKKVNYYNRYLETGDWCPDAGRYEILDEYRARFSDRAEVLVRVASDWECELYVDAILFVDGVAVDGGSHRYRRLDGVYDFEHGDEFYTVDVVAA